MQTTILFIYKLDAQPNNIRRNDNYYIMCSYCVIFKESFATKQYKK